MLKKKTIILFLYALVVISGNVFSQDIGNVEINKPITFHGNLGLNLMGYTVDGIPERQLPFSYVISANATASIYGIELPFSFVYSNRQRNYAQSFNQFGLSPRYKWITLHAGYRNVSFSNFTLAGHSFLGGGIELNPGIFRFGFVYGCFDRHTTKSPVFITDSLPRFARKGFAVKLGIGTKDNYFDLLFLRIRDDSNSIPSSNTEAQRTPEQNVVAGFQSHFTFSKKLTWETEAAVSLYTTDLSAKQFIDSTNAPILVKANKFLVVNYSSEYYTAIRSSLNYKAKNWAVGLEYKRIDPQFRSMGAYFFNNDLENLTLRPSFRMFGRKFAISGSIGVQRDNLRHNKRATSRRTIGNVNLSFNPSAKFGVDASYGNFSTNQQAGLIQLNDTVKVHQANHNFSLMPRLILINAKTSHMILGVYNVSVNDDKNAFTAQFSNFTSHNGQISYILGLLQSDWSFSFVINYTFFSTSLFDNTEKGGTIGISKSLLKKKLFLSWNNALIRSEINLERGWVFNSNLTGNYRMNKHHAFKLNLYFIGNYKYPSSVAASFNELKGDFGYVYKF